jgi:hypothetical protein
MQAECFGCTFRRTVWVHAQAVYNLIRASQFDRHTLEKLSHVGLQIRRWKQWKIPNTKWTKATLLRYLRCHAALIEAFPDVYGYFNRKEVLGGPFSSFVKGNAGGSDRSRASYYAECGPRWELPEWRALWLALARTPKLRILQTDVAPYLAKANGGPLARTIH